MATQLLINSHSVSKNHLIYWRSLLPKTACINRTRDAHTTVNQKELYHYTKLARNWWDPEGVMKALHSFNYIRLPFIRDGLVQVAPGEKFSTCLKGKKILDVGCGGGLLSEGIAKYGAEVTGIDVNKALIEVARVHSSKNKRLTDNVPSYFCTTIEEHCNEYTENYDAVVVSEVIEHIKEKEPFVESCVRATKPGGKLFFTTPNRTRTAQFIVIFITESVLKIVPKGTHEYCMFMRPSELQLMLEMNDCSVNSTKGFVYYPLANYWEWTKTKMCFFAIEAEKSKQ